MADVDKTTNQNAEVLAAGLNKWFRVKDRITLVASEVVNANVVKALKVKKGWIVLGTRVKIVTQAVVGTSLAAGVGDGDSGVGYDAAIDLTATAGTEYATAIGTDAYGASGKKYAADDTIDLTLALVGGVTTAPVLDVEAFVIDDN